MPGAASALYSRWWQLETWLRSLAYVELRSAKGAAWASELPLASAERQCRDDAYRYMRTPDAQDQLAYLDASPLLELTHSEWKLFGSYLPAQRIWAGRIEELKAIRNRIGHCRRPHSDDLDRLEQTLRDLDAGAFRAAATFNDHSCPNANWDDILIQDWVHKGHPNAGLIEHAVKQYETSFRLMISARPWASCMASDETKLGARPGYVWHACWYFKGGRSFDLAGFWQDIERHRDVVLLVCAESESSLQVSFSALEDPRRVSDAIDRCFDAALMNIRMHQVGDVSLKWAQQNESLDPRLHTTSPWARLDPAWRGVSVFSV